MDRPGRSLVTTLTKLSRLTKTGKIYNSKVNSQVLKKSAILKVIQNY